MLHSLCFLCFPFITYFHYFINSLWSYRPLSQYYFDLFSIMIIAGFLLPHLINSFLAPSHMIMIPADCPRFEPISSTLNCQNCRTRTVLPNPSLFPAPRSVFPLFLHLSQRVEARSMILFRNYGIHHHPVIPLLFDPPLRRPAVISMGIAGHSATQILPATVPRPAHTLHVLLQFHPAWC